jgi:hypothetical protein
MAAMIAGWVIPIFIRCVTHVAGYTLVLFTLVEMTVKRPHRPVAEGADDEPYHKKALEHIGNSTYSWSNLRQLRQPAHFLDLADLYDRSLLPRLK